MYSQLFKRFRYRLPVECQYVNHIWKTGSELYELENLPCLRCRQTINIVDEDYSSPLQLLCLCCDLVKQTIHVFSRTKQFLSAFHAHFHPGRKYVAIWQKFQWRGERFGVIIQ